MNIVQVLQDGSDRIFYRVELNGKRYILLKETKQYRFQYYIKVANILNDLAPKIYNYDEHKLEILMEDLGDLSLFEYMKSYKDYKIYYDVISTLKEIEEFRAELPTFDLEHLFYEINYFLNYNKDYLTYKDILYENAKAISKFSYVFMHRDFQSRNIILKDNKIRIIDFQTAHIGPKLYDLASLLVDPYVSLEDEIIRDLLKFYGDADYTDFLRISIQRICQVCAAFKKLSIEKAFFRHFIPIAINRFESLIKAFQ